MTEVDFAKKIALLGDPKVGKTSIQERYLGLGFSMIYKPTLGANFSIKDYHKQDKLIRVTILDLAGHPNFKPIRKHHFKGVSGCLLVFDVTRPFNPDKQILPWVREVMEYTNQNGLPLAVVGNKIDLDFIRQVPIYDGFNAATDARLEMNQQFAVDYFETSAKEGEGVTEAFEWLIETIMAEI